MCMLGILISFLSRYLLFKSEYRNIKAEPELLLMKCIITSVSNEIIVMILVSNLMRK
jgi:hypothetical protein